MRLPKNFGTPGAGPIIRLKEKGIVKCDFLKTLGHLEPVLL